VARYVLGRILQALVISLATSVVVFLILRLIPGDPALALAGFDPTPETVAAIRQSLGLDQPLLVQYVQWMGNVLHGDLGSSYINRHPVLELIQNSVPATLQLAVGGTLCAVLVGIPLGVAAAVRPNSLLDAAVSTYMTLGYAVPNFLLGILFMLVFALWLGWLPPGGRIDLLANPEIGWKFLVLPVAALAVPLSSVLARFQRAAMREVLKEDYVRTARAKGLGRTFILTRHALPNAALPVLTVLGIQFGQLLGGAVIVESVFAWPGIGRLLLQSVINRDYIVIQGVLLIMAGLFVLVNLLVDLAYAAVDPRVREQERTR
jgi:peptide/nickel transport system permease protein